MNTLKKCLAGFLVLAVTGMYFPSVSFCDGSSTDMKTITRHEPQIRSAPQEDIALLPQEEKKGPNWLWIGLGVAVLGGLVAAAGGGGGSDPGPEGPSGGGGGGDDTGKISVGW